MLSAVYLKSKRYSNFFSGLLILSVFIGLSPSDDGNPLGVSIKNPNYVDVVLCGVVIYYLLQIGLFWGAQGADVRSLAQHKIDFYMSLTIGAIALISFFLLSENSPKNWIRIPNLDIPEYVSIISISITTIGMIILFPLFVRRILSINIGKLALREREIIIVLTKNQWVLIFNPELNQRSSGTAGWKLITFQEDGAIGEGRNKNEHSWRLRSGFLELINENNLVFSRFSFNKSKMEFRHTNDPDTRSLRNQYIELARNETN